MMAECERGNVPLLQTTRHSPVKAEINGVLFSSEEYTFWDGVETTSGLVHMNLNLVLDLVGTSSQITMSLQLI